MDMKQILILGLLLVPAWTCKMHRCYEEHELDDAAGRRLRSHYPQPLDPSPAAAPGSPLHCPVELYRHSTRDYNSRSLSPWRYVHVTKKDHFPPTYAEAQCLCSGCILIHDNSGQDKTSLPVESHDYNSVPIQQSRVFLKRELCNDEQDERKKYHLIPVAVKVTVGCTCVRATTSS